MANKANKKYYITTTSGMSGHFAVMIVEYPDGFCEPQQTGVGRYRTPKEAEVEAKAWAKDEGLEYRGR